MQRLKIYSARDDLQPRNVVVEDGGLGLIDFQELSTRGDHNDLKRLCRWLADHETALTDAIGELKK